MATPISEIDDRIAALRVQIRQLLEEEAADSEREVLIVELLTQRNAELEKLAAERDALEQAEQAAVAKKQN